MRTARTLTLALTCCLMLASCGAPPWQQAGPSPTAATPSASPSATPAATAAPSSAAPNDLAKGGLSRTLAAGNTELTIKYWSTLDLAAWTPAATKPLSLSASAKFTDDSEQDIFLSDVQVAVEAVDAEGRATAVDPIKDTADVSPGYVVTAPTSYGQVFPLPAVPETSTALSVTITYQLLVQTAPDAKRYSRQAAVDRLQLALST